MIGDQPFDSSATHSVFIKVWKKHKIMIMLTELLSLEQTTSRKLKCEKRGLRPEKGKGSSPFCLTFIFYTSSSV